MNLERLQALAEEAGRIAQAVRAAGIVEHFKGHGELVTSADRAIHDHLLPQLSSAFPGTPLLTEESADHAIPRGPYLAIDEIDGTSPFAAGSSDWGVMLALIDEYPRQAVIHLPDKNLTIAAATGQGCTLNGRHLSLRARSRLDDAIIGLELNRNTPPDSWRQAQLFASHARTVRCLACSAASTLELLQGVTQLYFNDGGGKIWDFAAPWLAITEAGGAACDAHGQPLRWDQLGMSFLAASSEFLLKQALALRP